MSRLVSKRVKLTQPIGLTSDRYDFLGLEQAEPNLGDPLVGPSSVGNYAVDPNAKYILVANPNFPGKRFWALPQNIPGVGIVTFTEAAGVSTNVTGGYGNLQSLIVSGITTISIATSSYSTSTGALVVSGGVGIGSQLNVGGNISINGVSVGRIGIPTDNFFIGNFAGSLNISGNYNNFFGRSSGRNNDSGSNNNFFGAFSGFENLAGDNNNFFGRDSGNKNEYGVGNNFFGRNSGYKNIDGDYNVFIGENSGFSNQTGNDNIFIGRGSGYTNESGSNNVSIGNSHSLPIPDGSNQLSIGVNQNRWITGDQNFNVGIGTTVSSSKLTVFGNTNVVGVVTATDGFISVANTSPVQIQLVGKQLIFNVVGIGSTTFTLV